MSRQLFVENQNLENCVGLLDSQKGEPTIVGYARSACVLQGTGQSHSLETQRHSIIHTVRRKFGDNFRIIWICEMGPGNGQSEYLPGLRLAAKLVETGAAQHVAVLDHSRISRDHIVYYRFIDLLSKHQATLITPATEAMNSRAFGTRDCEFVHLMFGMYLGNKTLSEIADLLTQSGENGDVPTP